MTDSILTDVQFALHQLYAARNAAGRENARMALDHTQCAIDALERIQEALEATPAE